MQFVKSLTIIADLTCILGDTFPRNVHCCIDNFAILFLNSTNHTIILTQARGMYILYMREESRIGTWVNQTLLQIVTY